MNAYTLQAALEQLIEAAEAYAADQTGCDDPRFVYVPRITMADVERLIAVLEMARDALVARDRGTGGGSMRCEDCKWWKRNPVSEFEGECHRLLPRFGGDIGADFRRYDGFWPETGHDDFCGEFAPQEPDEETT